jgi:hypothetical protein
MVQYKNRLKFRKLIKFFLNFDFIYRVLLELDDKKLVNLIIGIPQNALFGSQNGQWPSIHYLAYRMRLPPLLCLTFSCAALKCLLLALPGVMI